MAGWLLTGSQTGVTPEAQMSPVLLCADARVGKMSEPCNLQIPAFKQDETHRKMFRYFTPCILPSPQ
jgi:hypothetical protein